MCRRLACLVLFTLTLGPVATEAAQVEWIRAAYWDARVPTNWADEIITASIRDGLQAAGYEILDAGQLKVWMDARIADGKYSVVVLCRDIVPDTVTETLSASCTLRRYLDAGGKVVHYADIPLYNQGHMDNTKTAWQDYGAQNILGFNTAGATRDSNQVVKLTAAGTEWGLTQTWQSVRPALPTATTNWTILATDNAGNAAAWVKHYVVGDTFRGFVRIWDFNVTATVRPTLDEIIRVAEYSGSKASNPRPADGATGVTMPAVQWDGVKNTTAHQVYLGTDKAAVGAATRSSPEFKGQQSIVQNAYIFILAPGTTYYWRIDELLADGTVLTGNVWSFTAASQAAWAPKPANGTTYVSPDVTLEWMPGASAMMGHDVYLGTDRAAVEAGAAETRKASAQLGLSYALTGLERGMTYYWRVDEVAAATVPGPVWSFTVSPVIAKADPSLIGWWKMENENSAAAVDSSGWDHHGMLVAGPQWVEGYAGDALRFDGFDDYVNCGQDSAFAFSGSVTITAWVKSGTVGNDGKIASNQNNSTGGYKLGVYQNKAEFEIRPAANTPAILNRSVAGGTTIQAGVWYHVAGVYSMGQYIRTYINGVLDRELATTDVVGVSNGAFMIGRESYANSYFWLGLIDDVRIYNRALSETEIAEVMQGDPLQARDPQPVTGSTVDIRDVAELSWSAGTGAARHDVYFGTDREAVRAAESSAPEYKGRQSATGYSLAGLVEMGGGSYFWRIDEVEADGTTIHKGNVWKFAVPGYLIVDEFENYTNDSPNRLFQTWLDGYGYSVNEFFPKGYLGNGTGSGVGHDIWTTGTTFTSIAERSFVHGGAQAMPLYYYNDSADTKYYSETERDWTTPQDLKAGGATDLSLWFKGRPVKFLQKPDGSYVVSSTSGDISSTSNDFFRFVYKRLDGDGSMIVKVSDLTATHQWAKAGVMIRETLDVTSTRAHMITTPIGRVAFENRATTGGNSASVYTAVGAVPLPVWLKVERKGTQFWGYYSKDGANWTQVSNANGGGGTGPNPQTITMAGTVYIGLCVASNNTVSTAVANMSNVTTTGTVTGDWTVADVGTEAQINPANDADDLYVAIQDKAGKVAVATWPDGTGVIDWTQWKIPLSQFTGVDTSAVTKIYIGVGSRNNPQPDGTGLIYIDDIRVIKP